MKDIEQGSVEPDLDVLAPVIADGTRDDIDLVKLGEITAKKPEWRTNAEAKAWNWLAANGYGHLIAAARQAWNEYLADRVRRNGGVIITDWRTFEDGRYIVTRRSIQRYRGNGRRQPKLRITPRRRGAGRPRVRRTGSSSRTSSADPGSDSDGGDGPSPATRRETIYTYGLLTAVDRGEVDPPDSPYEFQSATGSRTPAIARLGRTLAAAGIDPDEQLGLVIGLPDAAWDRLCRDLRDSIDRERAA